MSNKETAKTKTAGKRKKASIKLTAVTPSRDEIAQLAEKFWVDRGRPDGSPEQDWLRAETELVGMAT